MFGLHVQQLRTSHTTQPAQNYFPDTIAVSDKGFNCFWYPHWSKVLISWFSSCFSQKSITWHSIWYIEKARFLFKWTKRMDGGHDAIVVFSLISTLKKTRRTFLFVSLYFFLLAGKRCEFQMCLLTDKPLIMSKSQRYPHHQFKEVLLSRSHPFQSKSLKIKFEVMTISRNNIQMPLLVTSNEVHLLPLPLSMDILAHKAPWEGEPQAPSPDCPSLKQPLL